MSDLLEVIRQGVEARAISKGAKANVHVHVGNPKQPQMEMPYSETLIAKNDTRPLSKKIQMKCDYCGGAHFSVSCERVADTQARLEIRDRRRLKLFCLPKVWSSEQSM